MRESFQPTRCGGLPCEHRVRPVRKSPVPGPEPPRIRPVPRSPHPDRARRSRRPQRDRGRPAPPRRAGGGRPDPHTKKTNPGVPVSRSGSPGFAQLPTHTVGLHASMKTCRCPTRATPAALPRWVKSPRGPGLPNPGDWPAARRPVRGSRAGEASGWTLGAGECRGSV